MPLSFGLRDEDNERINNMLKKLRELTLVPHISLPAVDEVLSRLGLSLQQLHTMEDTALCLQLREKGTDWENMELFADVLVQLNYKEKARALYSYIQAESKVFSFEIMNKLNTLT